MKTFHNFFIFPSTETSIFNRFTSQVKVDCARHLEAMERDPKKCISAKALLDEGVSHSGFVVKEGGRFRSSMSVLICPLQDAEEAKLSELQCESFKEIFMLILVPSRV